MSFFQVSCLITFLASFIFGLFVLINNKKSKLNFLWFFTTLSISVWSLGFFGVVFSKNYFIAWVSQYFLDVGGIFIPILFFNFIVSLLNLESRYKRISIFSWVTAVLLIILNFTSLFKTGMVPYPGFDYWVNPGPFYFLFPLSFAFFSLYAFSILIGQYKKTTDKVLAAQIRYVILAQIFGVGGGITNFFPQLFRIYPFGNYLVVLYVVFISYATLKHHLFNIRIIATELFSLTICIFVLTRTLLSKDSSELIINGVFFLGIVVFAVLLVRSVAKEVKQREQIEAMNARIKDAYEHEKQAHTAETRNRERAEELAKDAQRLDTAKTQFIMATQHHLRTPLTAMVGYLDLLMGGTYGKAPVKIKEVLEKLDKSTKSEIRIINELLDISQFQLGKKVAFLRENIDLDQIIEEIMDDVRLEAQNKKIEFRLEKNSDLPNIKADPEKLKVALTNLIDNAVKYTDKGSVVINCEKTDGKIRIRIKDTGMGVAADLLPNLFSRVFERSEDAQKNFATGRGIGLYITSQIIKEHNGKVWAESEGKGKGSTFFVELPIA
jgi:signal transduction histidine kinase